MERGKGERERKKKEEKREENREKVLPCEVRKNSVLDRAEPFYNTE